MRMILIAAASVMLSATAALAGPMDVYFANTLVIHGEGGDSLMHFNADQTFHYILPDGAEVTGQWEIRDDKLCLTFPDGTNCWSVGPMQIGETASSTSESGETARMTLREGR